jgi:hypothetical protein
MTFKELIAYHLRQLVTLGYSQVEIAEKLGFPKPNAISMHLNPTTKMSPYPMTRFAKLAEMCELTPYESLQLVHKRATYHPESPTCFDAETLRFVLDCSTRVFAERKLRAEGALHGC